MLLETVGAEARDKLVVGNGLPGRARHLGDHVQLLHPDPVLGLGF